MKWHTKFPLQHERIDAKKSTSKRTSFSVNICVQVAYFDEKRKTILYKLYTLMKKGKHS